MNGRWMKLATVAMCAAVFTLAGCDGDDGNDGPPGPTGEAGLACWDLNENGEPDFTLPDFPFTEDLNDDGEINVLDCNATVGQPPGGGPSVNPVESCAVCHGDGSIADAVASHALPPIETVSNVAFTVSGADLLVDFDLEADGSAATDYDQVQRGYRNPGDTEVDICNAPSRNDPCDPASLALANNGGGSYTITVFGGAAEATTDNRYMFRVGAGDDRETRVYFYGDYPAAPFEPAVVSAEACTNCHGPEGIDIHGGYYAAVDGAEPCKICHGSSPADEPGEVIPALVEVVHGYHSGLLTEEEVTYPTYMNNCSVCHDSDETLTAANGMPFTNTGCFSCHGSTETMFEPDDPLYTNLHEGRTGGCQTCHVANGVASDYVVVTDAHNGLTTERGGIIWDGEDTSVTEGAKIAWEITDVADDGTDLTITWQASYDGAGVDPCNATAGAGAPVFFADGDGNLSILRNYAQGQDFILGENSDAAGQPGEDIDVDDTNTTCSGNVATTVVPVEETEAMYGRVGIQGKPRLPSVDPDDDDGLMAVRAKSPTYDWVVGEGGAAPERRAIVDTTNNCLKCHVGSLYQHGGNRVDNVDLCYLCHNPAANDQYVRVDTFDVDASVAYDGRSGQAFGIKEMLHAVHSAGATGAPTVIYRGRGIYAWAESEDQLSNWPGTGPQPVYGSDDGSGNPVVTNHNFHTPTYPRGLYECTACHVEDFAVLPNPTEAMATTVETGDAPFGDQLNDVLEGVTASSCMTCHQSSDAGVQSALKAHAYQNGWVPQEFEEGRQTIIDAN